MANMKIVNGVVMPRWKPMKVVGYDTGSIVQYVGNDDQEPGMWGGHQDDPRGLLQKGMAYTVDWVEVHSSYTRVGLKGLTTIQ